jgi:hypothetical protein
MSKDKQLEDAVGEFEGEGFYEGSGRSGQKYFQVFDFSICQRSKTEIEDWEGPITKQNPRTGEDVDSWVRRYDRLVARIIGFERKTIEFEKGGKATNWNFTLVAGSQKATLQLTGSAKQMEPVLKRLLKVAPNIDFERPLLISAWPSSKGGEKKQAVSFRQGEGKDVDKWDKVPEYWQRELDDDDKPTGPSTGRDGTVLPQPVHDTEEDEWDYRDQNKFLINYFRDNIKPKIDEIAERYEGKDFPTHSGPPKEDDEDDSAVRRVQKKNQAEKEEKREKKGRVPVTDYEDPDWKPEKPEDPIATSIPSQARADQLDVIKALTKAAKWKTETVAQKVLGCSYHEMSQEAADFLIYRLIKRMKKEEIDVPDLPKAKKQTMADEEDDWGTATVPAGKSKSSDDDDDWDEDPPKKSKSKSDDDDDDIPF